MNRGIARRTLFESAGDISILLEQIGEAVDRGVVEVHAFCALTTHYHLLVRSPVGELGYAMQRIQTEYSRWFNRSRRRDGPLVRGRYASKLVDSLRYRRAVVRYIDRNPVSAGIVPRASEYPHCSARSYQTGSPHPSWLERGWVESEVRRACDLPEYEPSRYTDVFGKLPEALARVIEARWRHRSLEDPLDELVSAAPGQVVDWMRRKARLADGTSPGLPVASVSSVAAAVEGIEIEACDLGRRSPTTVLLAGLVRELAGARIDEIADLIGCSSSAAARYVRLHRGLLQSEAEADYQRRAGEAAQRALADWEGGGEVVGK